MARSVRQSKILELIANNEIETQDEYGKEQSCKRVCSPKF